MMFFLDNSREYIKIMAKKRIALTETIARAEKQRRKNRKTN